MARKLKSDRILFTSTLLLVCASIVMVYSASAVVALERYQQPYHFLIRQGMWTLLGVAVLVITMRVDYRTYRNDTGNPGMATGGTGDVLTGLIAALVGQGLAPFDAAVLGVWAHGRAGDLAAAQLGQTALIATDLLASLPAALREAGG